MHPDIQMELARLRHTEVLAAAAASRAAAAARNVERPQPRPRIGLSWLFRRWPAPTPCEPCPEQAA